MASTNNNNNKSKDDFDGAQMSALLGGEDMFAGTTSMTSKKNKKTGDWADMTTAQTAEMLKEQEANKGPHQRTRRLRAAQKGRSVPQHVALLQEEQERLLLEQEGGAKQHKDAKDSNSDDDSSDDDDNDGFVQQRKERIKTAPQIVVRKRGEQGRTKAEPQVLQTRQRRRRDSSSSDSDASNDKSGDSSSSSDDDGDRRSRLLAKRRQNKQAGATAPIVEDAPEASSSSRMKEPVVVQQKDSKEKSAPPRSRRKEESTDSSSDDSSKGGKKDDGSSSDSGSSDSSSSSSSSDDEAPVMAKPLFVPKHKRHTIVTQEQKDVEEQELQAFKAKQEEDRKLSSRLLVQTVVAAAAADKILQENSDDDNNEGGGAMNSMPNDDDDEEEAELERDAWEVRELTRLLETQDLLHAHEAERDDYVRRQSMTDEERLREDEALGLYQRPGTARQRQDEKQPQGRYFHRGAFYMDQDEWDSSDVRHKAKEYERAVTGDDAVAVDRNKLPKVMQVKNFGKARQNTKYKGLAAEDTTDKRNDFLPIVSKKKNKRPRDGTR